MGKGTLILLLVFGPLAVAGVLGCVGWLFAYLFAGRRG